MSVIDCFENLLGHVDETGRELCKKGCPLVQAMAQRRRVEAQVFLHHQDCHRVPVHVRRQPIHDPDGRVVGAVEIFNEDRDYRDTRGRIETLTQISSTDALTQLADRQAAELSLRSRLAEVRDAGWPLGLLFADIDRFKLFDDQYGHAVGDDVLRVVGRSLNAALRESDVAARWGGKEFVIVTAASDETQLCRIAQRLQALVAASTVAVDDLELSVTLSIGATLATPADTVETLVDRADRAMYAGKNDGRNRVIFHPFEPEDGAPPSGAAPETDVA